MPSLCVFLPCFMSAVTSDLWLFLAQHITINHCQQNCWPLLLHCVVFFFSSTESNLFMLFIYSSLLSNHYASVKQWYLYQKSDIFNLLSEPAVSSQRLNTTLLLLLLSGRGKAPLLNASLLTSIMTVSRIEKPGRKKRHADDSQPQSAEFWRHTCETVQSCWKHIYCASSVYPSLSKRPWHATRQNNCHQLCTELYLLQSEAGD